MEQPAVAIVIVNADGCLQLQHCLQSIIDTTAVQDNQIWIIDTGSGSNQGIIRQIVPAAHLMTGETSTLIGGYNQALQAIRASVDPLPAYVLLLSPCMRLQPGALQALLHTLQAHPAADIAGPLTLNGNGSFHSSYRDFPSLIQEFLHMSGLGVRLKGAWYPSHSLSESTELRSVDYVGNTCMLVRTSALNRIGLFDEQHCAESAVIDWCLRLREAGRPVLFVPEAVVIYAGDHTPDPSIQRPAAFYRSRIRLFRKHSGSLQATGMRALLIGMTLITKLRGSDHAPKSLNWSVLAQALRG
jgi:N-acetylglucosaminyl-diphospho-decaprenol L-rhamnosyltransferase